MTALILFLAVFLILSILLRVPVPFAMGWATLSVFFFVDLPFINIAQSSFSALNEFTLLAVPFFLWAGALIENCGISKLQLDMIDAFIGRIRGSTGFVAIVGSTAFGALSGSAMATIAAIGKIMVPEMVRKGYSKNYSSALIASTCFLGIMIPPSIPGIFYALAADQKITQVWLSTIVPGLLFGIGYIIINYIKQKDKEEITQKLTFSEYIINTGKKTGQAYAALIMPLIIFGGIYGGIFTPTEAGAVSAGYGVIYLLIKRFFKKEKNENTLWDIMMDTASLTGVVSILVIFSSVSGRAITLSGASDQLASFVTDNVNSPILFLILVNLLFLLMGTFLDINSSILLMTPLLLPSALQMGIDPIHFGAISLVNLS